MDADLLDEVPLQRSLISFYDKSCEATQNFVSVFAKIVLRLVNLCIRMQQHLQIIVLQLDIYILNYYYSHSNEVF